MDLYKAIQDLYAERKKLEHVIASLEELQRAEGGALPPTTVSYARSRRGRKFMDENERKVVSQRMKKYWASRRERLHSLQTS